MSESPRPPVVVVGSCIMDFCVSLPRLPRLGETVVAGGLSVSHGGKGANQAVALARLGAAPRLIAAVGDDDFGRSFRARLRDEGVGVDLVGTAAAAPTGIGIPLILAGGGNAIVVAPGAAMSLRPEAVSAARREIAAAAALLLQLEVPVETAIAAMEIARGAGVEVFLNAAPVVEGAAAACRGAGVLVVNEIEAEALAGVTIGDDLASALAAAAALHRLGPAVVVVTLGERGAIWSGGAPLETARGTGGAGPEAARGDFVPGYRVAAVDPTGAGDAFCAGLVWSRVHGAAWRQAVELANACGALATTAVGAMAALPDLAAAEALVGSGDRWS
jgi:ribokinase